MDDNLICNLPGYYHASMFVTGVPVNICIRLVEPI